ncbi:MAG: hypothetical protein KDA96_19545 [Planctomycetaceae bacterium]|nr:hypothetical protein [Planctomycetaceae bacterium]
MRWRNLPAACITVAILLSGTARPAHAQRDGEEVVKGLLRALIESQLERDNRRHGNDRRVELAPPPAPGNVTPEMKRLRPLIASVVQELATLSALLNTDSRRSFDARRALADVVNLQAAATALKQQSDHQADHRSLVENYRRFSNDWRTVSHNLSLATGLSPQSKERIGRIDKLDSEYCQLLKIEDAFNSRELVRAADLLSADLHSLIDEVRFISASSATMTVLTNDLVSVDQRAHHFADLVSDGTRLATAIAEYRQLYQSWQSLRPRLDQLPGRSVSRFTSRIEETHRTIHELLRLEYGLDLVHIQRLADDVQRDLVLLFRSITLEQLLMLPDARTIPQSADMVSGTAQNLSDVIRRRESPQHIGEAWLYLDDAWRLLVWRFEPVTAPETQRQIQTVSAEIAALKMAIGVQVEYDPRAVAEQCAGLRSAADHLETLVKAWQRKTPQRDRLVEASADAFESRCRELALLAQGNHDRHALIVKCDAVILAWQQLQPMLRLCQTEESDAIATLADDLTPSLIRLRTMVGE